MFHVKPFFRPSLAVAAAALLVSAGVCAAPPVFQPAQSQLGFVAKQMGVPMEGRFRRFTAQWGLDPQSLVTRQVRVVVDMGSATLGTPEADAELPKTDWFNIAQFPQAVFESTQVRDLGGRRYEAVGQLSIKGVSAPVVVPFALSQQGSTAWVTGVVPVRRTVFKVGDKAWSDTSAVADEVRVVFKLAFTGVKPQ